MSTMNFDGRVAVVTGAGTASDERMRSSWPDAVPKSS